MFEGGLFQFVTQDPSLAPIIGGGAYWGKLPAKDTALPAIVMQVVTTRPVYSAQGATGLRFKSVQFDSYALTYTDALATSNALRAILEKFRGVFPDGTRVDGCVVIREMDMAYEPGTGGYIFRRLLEVEIQHTEN